MKILVYARFISLDNITPHEETANFKKMLHAATAAAK